MQEIHLFRDPGTDVDVLPISRKGQHVTVYHLKKGDKLPVFPDDGTAEDGTFLHFCAEGKMEYPVDGKTEKAGLFDSVIYSGHTSDIYAQAVSDAVVVVSASTDEGEVSRWDGVDTAASPRIVRNTVYPDTKEPIKKFHVDELVDTDQSIIVYYMVKGAGISISHEEIISESGEVTYSFDENETLVHYIAHGCARYGMKDHQEVLHAGESIVFHALRDDVMIDMLESTVLLISSTPDVDVDTEGDKEFLKRMEEIEKRDHYTCTHSNHVAIYTGKIAVQMGVKGILDTLTRAASLHDIGKVQIPDEVLLKPGKLTDEEFRIIQQHPEFGYQMLKQYITNPKILNAVRQHHERIDGSGYPKHMKDDEINLEARILMVADVFDALTTDRVYRPGFSEEKALSIMWEEANAGKLDATVLKALEEGIKTGKLQKIHT